MCLGYKIKSSDQFNVLLINCIILLCLQRVDGKNGSSGSFTLDGGLTGFIFVLKLNESTWLDFLGKDFFVPLSSSRSMDSQYLQRQTDNVSETNEKVPDSVDEIINDIRTLVSDISSEKTRKTKNKEVQENILQEIEKLAAEAYSIFRSSIPMFAESNVAEAELVKPPGTISSGTGTGFEVLCQGFNWESHKSRRWYMELQEKAAKLALLGFSVIWLPPPTDSVSPEGYMPTDLYNLNSRYCNTINLKRGKKNCIRCPP